MLRKYKDIEAIDELRPDTNKDLQTDIKEFNKFYSETWKKYFNNAEHIMDQK